MSLEFNSPISVEEKEDDSSGFIPSESENCRDSVSDEMTLDSKSQTHHSTQSLPDMLRGRKDSDEKIRPFQSNHSLTSVSTSQKETPKPRRSAFKKRDSATAPCKRVTIKENDEIIERRRVRTQSMPDEISSDGDLDRIDDCSGRRSNCDSLDLGKINFNDFIKPFTTSFASEAGTNESVSPPLKSKFSVTTVEEEPKSLSSLTSVTEEINKSADNSFFPLLSNPNSNSSTIDNSQTSPSTIPETQISNLSIESSSANKVSTSPPLISSMKSDVTNFYDGSSSKKNTPRETTPLSSSTGSIDIGKKSVPASITSATTTASSSTTTASTTTAQKTKEERKKEREKKKEEEMLKKYHMEQEAKQKASAKSKCGRWIKHNLKIGEGGYKFVYRGYDRQEALNVAWCEFKAEHVDTREKRQAMFHETEIMLKMNHPHIVRCFAVFPNWINVEDPNNPIEEKGVVIIQELMGEGTLKSVIRKNFMEGQCILKFPLITRWWHQILDALRYMHFKMSPPIIHRDLKAENCFVYGLSDEEFLNVKVGDFGLATHVKHSGRKTMLGTLGFMAPEIFDEKYDVQVDIYAFGMLMLEVMTNRTPYDECDSLFQVASKTMTGTGPEVMEKVTDPAVREVIAACIHPLTCFRPDAEELYHYPLFQKYNDCSDCWPKALPVEVEPILDKESDRAEVINRFVNSLGSENKNPKFNLRLRFRDKKMLQELGLDDGESLEFDLDIYEANDQDIPDLIRNLRLEYEDKLSRVFKNPKQTDKKIVSTHLDRLFTSIRLQMQFLVKVLLGRRWSAILAQLVEQEPKEDDEILNNTFKVISEYKTKWAKAKQMLDKEIETYRKQQQIQMEQQSLINHGSSTGDQPELLGQQAQETNETPSFPLVTESVVESSTGYSLRPAANIPPVAIPQPVAVAPGSVDINPYAYNPTVLRQIVHPSQATLQQSFSMSSMAAQMSQPQAGAIPFANYMPNVNVQSLQNGFQLASMLSIPAHHHYSLQPGFEIAHAPAVMHNPQHPAVINVDPRIQTGSIPQSSASPMGPAIQNNLQPVFQAIPNQVSGAVPIQVVNLVPQPSMIPPPSNIPASTPFIPMQRDEKPVKEGENLTYQEDLGGSVSLSQQNSTEQISSGHTILQPIGVSTGGGEQSLLTSELSTNPSNKTERKTKKKIKPKSRYLLQLTDIHNEPNDNPRLTFCLIMPDSSNPGEKTVWKLTFMCNLQDSIEDLSKPLFEALKEQAGKSCCLQEEIYNDLKETLSLVLRSLMIDRSSIKINEDYSFHPVPTSLGLASNSPLPTSQAPEGGFLSMKSSFDDNDLGSEECIRPPTSPVTDMNVTLTKKKLLPDGNLGPATTRSATSSPELIQQMPSDSDTPAPVNSTFVLTSVPELDSQANAPVGMNPVATQAATSLTNAPPVSSASSVCSKRSSPTLNSTPAAAGCSTTQSSPCVNSLQSDDTTPPITSASGEPKDELIQVTLTLPASLEDVMKDLSKRLLGNTNKSFVLAPPDSSCSNCRLRLLEVPEEHLFIGVPKPQDQGGGFSIIKSSKKSSFVVTHEKDAKHMEPKIYQVPNQGACILAPKGVVHHVDKPSIVVPLNKKFPEVYIAELPVSLDDQSLNMDVDDVITLMQTLKNVSQQIAPKMDGQQPHQIEATKSSISDANSDTSSSQILTAISTNAFNKSRNESSSEVHDSETLKESDAMNGSPSSVGPMSALPPGVKPPPATPIGIPYFSMSSSSDGVNSAPTFSPTMQFVSPPPPDPRSNTPQQAAHMQYKSPLSAGIMPDGFINPTMVTYQQPGNNYAGPVLTAQQMMPASIQAPTIINYQSYTTDNSQLTSPPQPVYMYSVPAGGGPVFMTPYMPPGVGDPAAYNTDHLKPSSSDSLPPSSPAISQSESDSVHQIISHETRVTHRYTVETRQSSDDNDTRVPPSLPVSSIVSTPSKFTVTSVPCSATSSVSDTSYPHPPPVSPAVSIDLPTKKKIINNRFVVETLPESRIDDAPTVQNLPQSPADDTLPTMSQPSGDDNNTTDESPPITVRTNAEPKMIGRFVVSSVSDS